MYREDFRRGILKLEWQGQTIEWKDIDEELLVTKSGERYKKNFEFDVNGKKVYGWVGILGKGGREKAGFAMIYCGRVIQGEIENWRPEKIYGYGGSNDLVNQRLVGEIHLDDFVVSHTKDGILWMGDEEEDVEKGLLAHCSDYRDVAKTPYKKLDDERGPSDSEKDAAIDELKKELSSPEMVDQISIRTVPEEKDIQETCNLL
jgi:hypothetical protein